MSDEKQTEEKEERGNPADVYNETIKSGVKSADPLDLRTSAEEESADRALEDLSKMEKENELKDKD